MSEAIVHIGFNKCGSTAIQKWLADNRDSLARQDVAFRRTDPRPEVVCSNPQVLDLAFSLADTAMPYRRMTDVLGYRAGDLEDQKRVTDAFRDEFETWVAGTRARTTILSNEFLGMWLKNRRLVRALDGWLRGLFDSVRYIAFIRAPLPWLISKFGHATKMGTYDKSLEAFVERNATVPFEPRLETWRKALPEGSLDVRLFHEGWLSDDGLIRDFGTACGIDVSATTVSAANINTGFAKVEGFLKQTFIRTKKPSRPAPSAQVRDRVLNANRDSFTAIQERWFADQRDPFLSWAQMNTT